MAPVCTVPRTEAQPMPHSRAPAMASSAARFIATGPGAACTSTIAIAARGLVTVTCASATDSPLSNSSRYLATRETPCESPPRRLAQTSASATAAASAARAPRAANTPATSARSSAASTTTFPGCPGAGADVSADISSSSVFVVDSVTTRPSPQLAGPPPGRRRCGPGHLRHAPSGPVPPRAATELALWPTGPVRGRFECGTDGSAWCSAGQGDVDDGGPAAVDGGDGLFQGRP